MTGCTPGKRTEGTLLGGRVRYAQLRTGYRTGIEPVLLAAIVPVRPGERVLEGGCGAGAGLLCLLWRVPGAAATGIEVQPDLAALARDNLGANGFAGTVACGDLTASPSRRGFDHAFANPPWHDPAGTRPPNAGRARATHGAGLAEWIAAMAAAVAGTVSLVLPASQAGGAAAMLGEAGFGTSSILDLVPKAGRPPRISLLQARRGDGGAIRRAALVLHQDDGRYTKEADAVLRHGVGLSVTG